MVPTAGAVEEGEEEEGVVMLEDAVLLGLGATGGGTRDGGAGDFEPGGGWNKIHGIMIQKVQIHSFIQVTNSQTLFILLID